MTYKPCKLVTFKHPSLRTCCIEVVSPRDIIASETIIEEMRKTIEEYNGIGLAAPQIGYGFRIIMIKNGQEYITILNPDIEKSEGSIVSEEGCLSIPGIYGKVNRAKTIWISGYTSDEYLTLTKIRMKLTDKLAIVAQHEVDHLDGILFIDRQPTDLRIVL